MTARKSGSRKKTAGRQRRGTSPKVSIESHHRDWLNLIEIEGPFLSIPVLKKAFPDGLEDPDDTVETAKVLRAGIEEWELGLETGEFPTVHANWVWFVLRRVLELDDEVLKEGPDLPPDVTVPVLEHGETLSPDYVVVEPKGAKDEGAPRMLIQVVPYDQDLDRPVKGKRWKASPADRMTEMLRGAGKKGVPLGLLTNGSRWMLVHAPRGETVGKATWDAVLWVEERITLRAFRSLLGLARFFVEPEQRLDALLAKSADDQQALTDQLGAQVRRAVEVIVQSFDRLDRDSKRELLEGTDPRTLYEASVTVMMRLVFLLYAEEQQLLPLEDPLYSKDYSASNLLDQLQEEADRHGPSILERRHSAWSRLLATFRAVHGGVEHEAMRLPAYGGSLFDPDRYPFLEGRAEGTSWRNTPAQPLAIDDYTVLQILSLLQYLGSKSFDGQGKQAMRLSFKGLGVEQIGHVYEGLLDHTAVRAAEPVLGLFGKAGLEPEIPIAELEKARKKSKKEYVEYVKDATKKTQKTVEKAIAYEIDDGGTEWLVACDNNSGLYDQVKPYAGLVRRDPSGHPVVIPEGSIYVTQGSDRRSTGAHYTPPSLTEPIAKHTLEPLVYEGPAQGKPEKEWRLRSPREILALKVCDLAMGSGAFLVAACRYLAERLVEAWEECEKARPGRILVTPEGDLSEGEPREALVPADATERLAAARRFVADRCLYGVDKDPMAVEMGKLSLWLVTLQKGKPFSFLDHALKNGDSLLGVSRREQLEAFDLSVDGKSQLDLFGKLVDKAMTTAREHRDRLERMAVNDVRAADEKARLLAEADAALGVVRQAGDLLTAAALSTAGESAGAYESRRGMLAEALGMAIDLGLDEATRKERFADLKRQSRELLDEGKPASEPVRKPFHWPLEFPEVFEKGGFDAFVGNPPFITGKRISTTHGQVFQGYLKRFFRNSKGAADLVNFFMRRAFSLLRPGGATGLIATKSISETEAERNVGLRAIQAEGGSIYLAKKELAWPGVASVFVNVVWVVKGDWNGPFRLGEELVPYISSRLDSEEDIEIYRLSENAKLCSDGVHVHGDGFKISDSVAKQLLRKDARNSQVISRYVTGIEIAQSPPDSEPRWVLNFGIMDERSARSYPDAFRILEETVKEYRDSLTGQIHEECFWRHWDKREEFFASLGNQPKILACPKTAKFLLMVLIDSDSVPSDSVKLFSFPESRYLCLLQSSIHEVWIRRQSGRTGLTLSYNLRFGFGTFPLVRLQEECESLTSRVLEARERIMVPGQLSLTEVYNLFHDSEEESEDIARLRELHVEMDQAVAAAYGWDDLDLGHGFHETDQGTRYTLSAPARRQVLARLLELNHLRYAEEVAKRPHSQEKELDKKEASRKVKPVDANQAELFGDATKSPQSPGDPTQALVDALRAAGEPLSKSQLLEATGVPANEWNRAIKPALDSGAFIKTGERRSTRYSIPRE